MAQYVLIGGKDGQQVSLDAAMANRHGLIAGATGTGKTVTLQALAEGFSRIGVPVFMADVKGDLSGIAQAGSPHKEIDRRIVEMKLEGYTHRASPTIFWDIFGKQGHPVRTTISEMGPLLLAHMLELNDTQSGVLYAAFRIADDEGLLLLDFKDLRAMLVWLGEHRASLSNDYGNISSSSLGAIQRKLLVLEAQGAAHFFAEPAIALHDLMMCDFSGQGVISLLDVSTLIHQSPKLYATFLIWLMAELFENLPEVGDADKPKLVLFFDEAHLLFNDAPKVLLEKVEQMIRLIRSKGVGVYFISQSPTDIPEDVLGQLGMRIQHALRAFTPKDQRAVRAAAETFRPNPKMNTQTAITELGIGEALVSTLDEQGSPTAVERVWIRPPESKLGPVSDDQRQEMIQRSPMFLRYQQTSDRESAYELLKARAEQSKAEAQGGDTIPPQQTTQAWSKPTASRQRETVVESMLKSAARTAGTSITRRVIRGLLGSLLGK